MTDTAGNALADFSARGVTLTNDSTVPTVSSVSTDKIDGSYKVGDTVDISVEFSEVVAVTGTPTITLETGATDQDVDYVSGSGSDTLLFTYTVQSGDTSSSTLDYVSTSGLAGTIKDLAGNAATLTLPAMGATGSLGDGNAILIDTTSPYIISRTTEAGSTTITLRFTEAVSGAPDGSDFTVLFDGAAVAVTDVTLASDGLSASLTVATAVGSSTTVTLDYAKNATASKQLVDAAGNAIADIGDPVSVAVSRPTVISIASDKAAGTYAAGEVIDIQLGLSETVTVDTSGGTPTLKLEVGDTDRTASYYSGSGTDELTFRYTVQAGDQSDDLDYHATDPFKLNSGTIQDADGNSIITTLPSAGGAGSLSYGEAIVVDAAPPTISTYAANAGTKTITLTTANSETVTGSPANDDFSVLVGSASNAVTDVAVSGSTITLTVTNTIANDATVTVGYTKSDTSSEQITDAAGNALATLSSAQTVTVTNDGTAPTISSVTSSSSDDTYKIGDTVNVQVVFSEDVAVTTTNGTPTLTLETGTSDRAVSYSSGSGSDTLIFAYTVQSGDTSADLDYKGTTSLALNNGTIKDLAGNTATLTLNDPTAAGTTNSLADNKAIVIDGVLPTISTYAANAGTKTITLTTANSETVTGSPANDDFSVLVGSASNAVTDVAVSGSTITLTVTNTIANDATVTVGYTKSDTSSEQITDAAGNALATLSSAQTVTVTNDGTAPTISSVTSSSSDDTYKIGDTVNVQVVFSEDVAVTTTNGTPTLTLETGTSDRAVSYSSGSGSDTLIFAYTVQSGDTSADLDYKGTTSLALNNGTIKDLAGNTATLTLNDPTAAGTTNSLADNKAIVIDGVLPTISTYAANAGTKTITLTTANSETVTGSPANDDFSVLVGSASNAVTNVAVSGSTITLTVTNTIANDATVTVGYTKSDTSSEQITDAAGMRLQR
jgi:uncharacterized repeat protein (TIGR02059 family)